MPLSTSRKTALIAFVAFDVLLVIALISLFQLRSERQTSEALRAIGTTIYPDTRSISDFRLLDQAGEIFTKSDFEGHWNLVFFGFTHCPDICPLTMAELKQFYQNLDFNVDVKPRIFLVTVYPQRDNPESIASYLKNYNEDFIGLSGDPQAIAQLASELYVAIGDAHESNVGTSHAHGDAEGDADAEANIETKMTDVDYKIEHSGHIAIIDPKGNYFAVMRAPHRDRDISVAFSEITK